MRPSGPTEMPAAPAQICAFSPEDATELVANCELQLSDLQRRECQIGGPFNERRCDQSVKHLRSPAATPDFGPAFSARKCSGVNPRRRQATAELPLPSNLYDSQPSKAILHEFPACRPQNELEWWAPVSSQAAPSIRSHYRCLGRSTSSPSALSPDISDLAQRVSSEAHLPTPSSLSPNPVQQSLEGFALPNR